MSFYIEILSSKNRSVKTNREGLCFCFRSKADLDMSFNTILCFYHESIAQSNGKTQKRKKLSVFSLIFTSLITTWSASQLIESKLDSYGTIRTFEFITNTEKWIVCFSRLFESRTVYKCQHIDVRRKSWILILCLKLILVRQAKSLHWNGFICIWNRRQTKECRTILFGKNFDFHLNFNRRETLRKKIKFRFF